eukprot:GHVP01001532.1.p1 GENE.GHVP01001532.1~~GHVP01001532.1.p1  ORF type:complete len:457 (+),score=76.15 GHVP01001532.1:2965-4335(+)
MGKRRPRVYVDVSIGSRSAGRIVWELYTDIAPQTCENFRGLCTGEYGLGLNTGMPLTYEGCRFFRIIPGQIIQCGDFETNSGKGGESVYGGTFRDENFMGRHGHAGVLSMANRGRNTNGSQFFVTLGKCTQFDGKHVAFGQVVDGMEVIRAIEKVPVHKNDVPRVQVIVTGCGEIKNGVEVEAPKVLETEDKKEQDIQEEPNVPHVELNREEFPDEVNRLEQLRLKMNQSRVLNTKSVILESKMENDPKFRERAIWKERQELRKEEAEEAGLCPSDEETEELLRPGEKKKKLKASEKKKSYIGAKEYMHEPASSANYRYDKEAEKEQNRQHSFGWQVFSTESQYRAHEKKIDDLNVDRSEYEEQKESLGKDFYNTHNNMYVHGDYVPSDTQKERLVQHVEKQIKKRSQFQRRRPYYEEMNVTHINERNRRFNMKLDRYFKNETAEIRANLERGTAL